MIKVNKHLTQEGLEQILIIKAQLALGMNTGRSKTLPAYGVGR